jgi:hypothetical protein
MIMGLLGLVILGPIFALGAAILAWPLILIYVLLLAWDIWCVITNHVLRLQVGNGIVAWDSVLPFRSKTKVPVREIVAVEVNLDDKYDICLRLEDGGRKKPLMTIPFDPDEFVAAVVAENPSIIVERDHRGSSS